MAFFFSQSDVIPEQKKRGLEKRELSVHSGMAFNSCRDHRGVAASTHTKKARKRSNFHSRRTQNTLRAGFAEVELRPL